MTNQPPDPPADEKPIPRLPVPLHSDTPEQLWRKQLDSDDPQQKAGAALALGRFAAANGELDKAAALLREAAESNLLHVVPRALVQLIPVLESLGRSSEATEALEDALAAGDPRHIADASVDLAAILASRAERGRAIAVLRSVIENWPEREESAEDVGDMTRAVAALRLGTLLDQEGQGAEALAVWRLALNSNYPAITPVAALRLAEALVKTESAEQKPAEIEELYRVAVDFGHPSASPEAAIRLASRLAEEAGQLARAEVLCKQVLRAGGRFGPRAQKELIRLREMQSRAAARPRSDAKRRWLPLSVNRRLHQVVKRSLRTLIVGAGTGGSYLLHDLPQDKYHVLGWLDDHPPAAEVQGFPVHGTIDETGSILDKLAPDIVLIAIPTLAGERRRIVVEACLRLDIPVRNLPSMFELLRTDNIELQLREVLIEETIGSRPVEIDREAGRLARGGNVMVTGAGGSLGEELCRQIAHARSRHLALVDNSSIALRRIIDELENQRRFDRAFAVLEGCADEMAMKRMLSTHRPEVVFHVHSHASAPILETHPIEAVRKNVLDTWAFARACGEANVRRFVLVSNPDASSLRGVFDTTQALAERAVEAVQEEHHATDYITVRVGNLFRSSGSVVDIFESQIERGAPVTITDGHAARRFMRTQLAAQLLMRAADTAKAGRVYTLSGGDFLRIKDLAERMIRLKGHEPGEDIPLTLIGPRSWERNRGAPTVTSEQIVSTDLEEVSEIRRRSPGKENVEAAIAALEKAVATGEPAEVRRSLVDEVTPLLETSLAGGDSVKVSPVTAQ
jgi:FlaA1/EpsC-like NDP-sugar epimerase/tetratricopeptide (TPR) repeat protein